MAEAVPAERSDAVAGLDVERPKDMRERVYAAVEIGVGIAVHAVRDFARDFLAGEELGGTLEEVGERERVVHHETLHSGHSHSSSGNCAFLSDQTAISDRKSTRLNSSHLGISYAVFCL